MKMLAKASSTLVAMTLCMAVVIPAHADVSGKYNASCATCHQAGVLGAQKKGDKAAWAKALKKGKPTLLKHVKEGFNNMPARGLCDNCSDADYKALIDYMSK